jgi:hypothetical protein
MHPANCPPHLLELFRNREIRVFPKVKSKTPAFKSRRLGHPQFKIIQSPGHPPVQGTLTTAGEGRNG